MRPPSGAKQWTGTGLSVVAGLGVCDAAATYSDAAVVRIFAWRAPSRLHDVTNHASFKVSRCRHFGELDARLSICLTGDYALWRAPS